MITCRKRWDNLPAAHRQPLHDGHCSKLHGHNWSFEIEFYSTERDMNNFVVDFGKLSPVKEFLQKWFDHTLLVQATDPLLQFFNDLDAGGVCVLRVVESASCEGLALFVYDEVTKIVRKLTSGRVQVMRVICYEDTKNSAEYYPLGKNFSTKVHARPD